MRLLMGAYVQIALYWAEVYVCVPHLRRPFRMVSWAVVHVAMNWVPLLLGGCGQMDCLVDLSVVVWCLRHVPCMHWGQM